MKSKIILCSILAMGWTAGASAVAPMLKPMLTSRAATAAAAPEDSESMVLIEEDFSRMKAGSETTPDSESISNRTTGEIPASYTLTPGWSGACIYQAGGSCAILTGLFSDGNGGSFEDTGFLRTPQGAYSGNVTLTFRAKLLDSSKTSDKMDVALLNSSKRLESKSADITPEWKSYEITFTKGEFTGCLIQFAMISEKVLIDDIRVTSVQTAIPAPQALEATDFKRDGFTAHWNPTDQASSYLLNLYEKKVDEAVTVVDFENVNVIPGTNLIDPSNTGLPEGWTFVYGLTRNKDHVSNLGQDGTRGIIFRTTGEGFITPVYERPIRDFSFYATYPSGEPCMSTLTVLVMINGQWGALGNYDVERISPDGQIVRISNNFPEGGVNAVQVVFKKNEQYDGGKDVDIVVDNIRIMTYPENSTVKTDIPVSGLEYTFSELDPEKDYAYTVKAVNDTFSSKESNEVVAIGLSAPELLEASDLTNDSYTANWQYTPKAEGYIVNNYKVYTVTEPTEKVNILHETFDKVTEGTLSNPVGLYNVAYPRALDEYTENPGWLGLATYLVNGMIGTRNYYIVQGMIQTPALNLSGNNGRFDVHVRVVGDTDAIDEQLVVQAGQMAYKRGDIKPGEPVELDFSFTCGDMQMPLAFYSYYGFPFYLDEVTVTQTLPSGAQVYYEMEDREVVGGTTLSAVFDKLQHGVSENYAYRVFAYRDFMGGRVYSYSTSVTHVDASASADSLPEESLQGPVEYYTVDGIRIKGEPNSPGIYIRKAGNKTDKIIIR